MFIKNSASEQPNGIRDGGERCDRNLKINYGRALLAQERKGSRGALCYSCDFGECEWVSEWVKAARIEIRAARERFWKLNNCIAAGDWDKAGRPATVQVVKWRAYVSIMRDQVSDEFFFYILIPQQADLADFALSLFLARLDRSHHLSGISLSLALGFIMWNIFQYFDCAERGISISGAH
jgi:hypothetical protein